MAKWQKWGETGPFKDCNCVSTRFRRYLPLSLLKGAYFFFFFLFLILLPPSWAPFAISKQARSHPPARVCSHPLHVLPARPAGIHSKACKQIGPGLNTHKHWNFNLDTWVLSTKTAPLWPSPGLLASGKRCTPLIKSYCKPWDQPTLLLWNYTAFLDSLSQSSPEWSLL